MLRPYQIDCLTALATGYAAGHRKQLAFLPTGAGKTEIFLHEAARRYEAGQSVLILAHRDDLVQQPFLRARTMGLPAVMEKATRHATPGDPFVIGSLQSLWNSPQRVRRKFDLVIYDECHHSVSPKAKEFLASIDTPETDFLGVTATPHRHDQLSLGEWWPRVAYEITLPELVHQGWLAPIMVECLPVGITLPSFPKEIPAEQADALLQPVLELIAQKIVESTHDRRHIVIFLPLIATSKKFAAILTAAGLPSAHVDGEMGPARKDIEARFRAGEFRCITNSMVLTEGWDAPWVDCVVPLRPVKSAALYSQMLGRGCRLFDGKDYMLLLDLLWQTKQHLARPASLFSPDPELSYLASQIASRKRCNLADLAAETGRNLQIAREAALARQTARQAKKASYKISYTAMCEKVGITTPPAQDFTGNAASEKQLKLLRNFKVDLPAKLSASDASMLIGRLMMQRRRKFH